MTSEPVGRVVLMPFVNMSARFGENTSVSNPLTRKVFVTGPVVEGAEGVLTEKLQGLLQEKALYPDLVSPGTAGEALGDLSATAGGPVDERELLMRTGRHFDADAVLTGRLYRFVQRVGSGYGIESPASVAFDIVMFRVDTGQVIWRGHLDETQTSLSENLFSLGRFLKRKGRWVTAEEMAGIAMTEMVEALGE